ncbi:hypothetical protein [Jeotgalibacillus malaysiensis]|uniref:hypothetical protein n=1 Tax=Jeotgalibacillus malaysiensis TaxID=1508404 RepID=UPI00384AE9E9
MTNFDNRKKTGLIDLNLPKLDIKKNAEQKAATNFNNFQVQNVEQPKTLCQDELNKTKIELANALHLLDEEQDETERLAYDFHGVVNLINGFLEHHKLESKWKDFVVTRFNDDDDHSNYGDFEVITDIFFEDSDDDEGDE